MVRVTEEASRRKVGHCHPRRAPTCRRRVPIKDPLADVRCGPAIGRLGHDVPSRYVAQVSMKWLTREWASGALDDYEWDSHWRDSQVHCTAVVPRLRNGAERLVQGVNMHDGQIQSFEYRHDGALVVRALVGDLQVGYEYVELSFVDAELRLEPEATIDLR